MSGREPPVYDARISGRSRISEDRLLVLAYITAISIPPLGLALAIAVALRLGKTRHAVWIALLSLATAAVWVLILTSGSLNSASSSDF